LSKNSENFCSVSLYELDILSKNLKKNLNRDIAAVVLTNRYSISIVQRLSYSTVVVSQYYNNYPM